MPTTRTSRSTHGRLRRNTGLTRRWTTCVVPSDAIAVASPARRPLGPPSHASPIDAATQPSPSPRSERLLKRRPGPGDLAATGGPPAGRISIEQARRAGPAGWLQILGPGLITGASDDDPSGIGTYSQVGSPFGYGLLWTPLFTFPLMAAVQELCARIALQTGVGLGVALRRKFPTGLVGVCVAALFIANTINVGADLGAIAAGAHLLVGIPNIWLLIAAALLIVVLELFVTYSVIFQVFKWLTLALFAYVITAFVVHPQVGAVLWASLVPHVEPSRDYITATVAVLG